MSGLNAKRVIWTIVFLGITLTAIVMEVVAGVFHPSGTIPWTEYIARYVPWPVQLIAYVALAVWLPFHFWRHDHLRKVAFREGYAVGKSIGYNNGRQDADRIRRGNTPAGQL
jgi:putative Ca2+/H+ antiporter (TMEM165/GDT1 family)